MSTTCYYRVGGGGVTVAVAICRVAPLSGSLGMVNEGLCKFNRVVAAHDIPVLALTTALLLVIFVFANTLCHDKMWMLIYSARPER